MKYGYYGQASNADHARILATIAMVKYCTRTGGSIEDWYFESVEDYGAGAWRVIWSHV